MPIKYRIGIMPGPWPAGREGATFLWTLCDQLEQSDVDSIWLSDRLSSPVPVPEAMTTLAAIAARTTRLKFGPSVIVLPYRTPVVAAKEMATVDWLSQGRLFPAVGGGGELPREFAAAGGSFAGRGRSPTPRGGAGTRRPGGSAPPWDGWTACWTASRST